MLSLCSSRVLHPSPGQAWPSAPLQRPPLLPSTQAPALLPPWLRGRALLPLPCPFPAASELKTSLSSFSLHLAPTSLVPGVGMAAAAPVL